MNFKTFKKGVVLGVTILAICALSLPAALAQVVQTPLPGNMIPQFVDPLPGLDAIVDSGDQIELQSKEFQAPVMPSTFVPAVGPYTGTWVWGYLQPGQVSRPSYIGPVIVAERGDPTTVKWVNDLGSAATTNVLAYKNSTDQTLHWADPLGCKSDSPPEGCDIMANYDGSIPDVTHLHGGEVPAEIDGGPDAWYTSDSLSQGPAYYPGLGPVGNSTVFRYPNVQEPAPIWFHPHPLGVTRLNVYAGLAGAYLINDIAAGNPANLPELIPLVVQDRMFDVNGQLYFPNIGINPEHPYWIPEFVGDTIVVNGKVWPFQAVNRQRYTLLFLNGSNARFYDTFLIDAATGVKGPRMWVIATDGGYLDNPVLIDPNATGQQVKAGAVKSLVFGPGERYEVIVDFNDPTWIANLTAAYGGTLPATVNLQLRNNARTPFPGGAPAPNSTTGRIMQFRVNTTAPAGPDGSYDPSTLAALRSNPIVRLPGTPAGPPISAATVQVTRQLTLNEVIGAGGPLEILVNNTKWNGLKPDGINPITDSFDDGIGNWVTERPTEGQTEVWEIINLTADAHPIHLHLVQFQLINRQPFDVKGYTATYDAAFLTGIYTPAVGPPSAYNTPNADGAVGGNPPISGFLNAKKGPAVPPLLQERGWKDTVIMYPGEVTRIAVRWAPQDLLITTAPTDAFFAFDPSGSDYVWHCHILDHEDNEMMRPTLVTANPDAPAPEARDYKKGTDY
jgi:FtsP/CotA-like multicopper oxidase with cupredoxin domain